MKEETTNCILTKIIIEIEKCWEIIDAIRRLELLCT
jgi:hypothetical protein